jgi:hypothetical protein
MHAPGVTVTLICHRKGLSPTTGGSWCGTVHIRQQQGRLSDTQLTIGVGEALEDVAEQSVNDVQHLEIVLPDLHLEIQPRELAQMPVRV